MKRTWMKQAQVVLFAGIAALSGCDMEPMGTNSMLSPPEPQRNNSEGESAYLGKTAISDETGTAPEAAVDMALQWAKRCSDLSQQLQQENGRGRVLQQENAKFKQQVAKLQTNLSTAEKELRDANLMLMDLQKQLEGWKTNVLGFRKEMRQAQEVELKALYKILKLLGGEVVQTAGTADVGTRPAPQETSGDETRPVLQQAPPPGEKVNESAS